MNEFKPGLEGIVAVETAIAAPDREGGALRYRGYDIEELVGRYPYENVWGLLVDDDIESKMPDPEPYEPKNLTGNAPADLQAQVAHLAGEWKLKKLVDIDAEQTRDDLGRLSAQMMGIVARSAAVAEGRARGAGRRRRAGRDRGGEVPAPVARRGESRPRQGDRHVLDLHGRARPQRLDVHGARRRLDRR